MNAQDYPIWFHSSVQVTTSKINKARFYTLWEIQGSGNCKREKIAQFSIFAMRNFIQFRIYQFDQPFL